MNEAPKLPVPQIKESHDLVINAAGVPSSGMTAVIVPYAAMSEGDHVTFTWQGYDADGIADPVFEQASTLTREALGKPLKWVIPRSKISGIPGGRAEIGYQIDYATDLPKTSPSSKQVIHAGTLSPTLLAPPRIVGLKEGEVLDPATFPGGLTLNLTTLNPQIQIGDDVVLYAKGARRRRVSSSPRALIFRSSTAAYCDFTSSPAGSCPTQVIRWSSFISSPALAPR